MIVDDLEAMARAIAQTNKALYANHNQNGGDDEFRGLENSRRITCLHSRKGIILKVPNLGFRRLRIFSESWHVLMLIRFCLDLICCLRELSIDGRIPAKD